MQEEEFRRNCELRAKDEPVTNQQAIEALDHIVKNPRRDAEDTRTLNQAVSVLENFIYIHAGTESKALDTTMQEDTEAKPIEPTCSMCPSYPRIQAEIARLTAECQKWQEWHDCEYRERKKYRQDANYFSGEIDRLRAELKEREAEVERLNKKISAQVESRNLLMDSYEAEIRKWKAQAKRERDFCEIVQTKASEFLTDRDNYKTAVDDALIISNIGVASGDAKADLNKLLAWEISVALDPQVSKAADDLVKKVARECAKIACGCEFGYTAAKTIREKYEVK